MLFFGPNSALNSRPIPPIEASRVSGVRIPPLRQPVSTIGGARESQLKAADRLTTASSEPAQVLLVRFPRDSIRADHGDRDQVRKEQRGHVDQAEIEDHVRIDLAGLGAFGK
jgi:hypothetical protein